MQAGRPIGTCTLQHAAKVLAEEGYCVSQCELFDLLRRLGWMHGIRPSAGAKRAGYLVESQGCYARGIYVRTFISGSGIEELKGHLPRRREVETLKFGPYDGWRDTAPVARAGSGNGVHE